MSNNPANYRDPSGHAVENSDDAGNCDLVCFAKIKDLSPGTILKLNNNYRSDEVDEAIENYMASHPGYDFYEDDFGQGGQSQFIYSRQDYWQNRAENAGLCYGSCPGDIAYNLRQYYDQGKRFSITQWDSSRINWNSVTLDAVGIPLGVIGKPGLQVSRWGQKVLTTTGLIDSGGSFTNAAYEKDGIGMTLSFFGAFPVIGSFASSMALGRDLGQAMYQVQYVPPLPRIDNPGR